MWPSFAGDGMLAALVLTVEYKKKSFKGWTLPGPVPPGALGKGPEVDPAESLDALSGHYRIFQLRKGHRFSTDDVLTAWYASSHCPRADRILDLGSGIGTVASILAWRLPGAHLVTVEAQEESVRLARKSAEWNGLQDRFEIRQGDFREGGILGAEEQFDLVTGSPPYFPLETGVTGDHPQKVACRFEVRGTIADYCRTAARHLAPGGLFACVFPMHPVTQEVRVQEGAAAQSLTIIRDRPVVLREGDRPLLKLFAMMRTQDLPPRMHDRKWTDPPLIIRCQDGTIHPEYTAVKLSFGFPP